MTEKSVSVEGLLMCGQLGCVTRAGINTPVHISTQFLNPCGNVSLEKMALFVEKAKTKEPGTDGIGNGEGTITCFAGMLHPSAIGKRRITKKQYWSMASSEDREFLTELNKLFNIGFSHACTGGV